MGGVAFSIIIMVVFSLATLITPDTGFMKLPSVEEPPPQAQEGPTQVQNFGGGGGGQGNLVAAS